MMPPDLSKVATECFASIMRYMGDLPMQKSQNEVDCVYTILVVSFFRVLVRARF